MKSFIILCIFVVELLSLPYPSTGSSSPPHQVSFVVDLVKVAPVTVMVQDSYIINREVKNVLPVLTLIYQKGGDCVEVQTLGRVTQPTYLNEITALSNTTEVTNFDNYGFRICRTYRCVEGNKLKANSYFIYHRARDGLTCS